MKAGSISFLTALGWLPSSERMYVTLTDLLSLSLPSYENLAGLRLRTPTNGRYSLRRIVRSRCIGWLQFDSMNRHRKS
jgi:hypothetical protein